MGFYSSRVFFTMAGTLVRSLSCGNSERVILNSVLVNQSTVHSGGAPRGMVCGCGCWRCWHCWRCWPVTGDRWQLTHHRWHMTSDFFLGGMRFCSLCCHYPCTLRYSVSPVCRILKAMMLFCGPNFPKQNNKLYYWSQKLCKFTLNSCKRDYCTFAFISIEMKNRDKK